MRLSFPALFLVLGMCSSGYAVENHGVVVPDQAGEMPLRGTGLLRWKWVFRIYVGAFYVAAGTPESAVLTAQPKRLEFTYQRAFSASDLRQATDKTLFRGLSEPEITRLKPILAIWNAGYPDVVAGDRLTIDQDAAFAGHLQAGGQLHEGGLAAARWPDDGDELALFDLQIDVFHRKVVFGQQLVVVGQPDILEINE
jgi:hypothetical protein